MSQQAFFQPSLSTEYSNITILFNGTPLQVPCGISVAAALLMSGVIRFRTTPVSQSPRAPWCMMGICFECLLEIDGQPNKQGCLTMVAPNMVVRTQEGAAHYE